METIFLMCFIVGALFAIGTAIFGELFHTDASHGEFPFLSPTTIGSFVTVFGGVGFFTDKTTDLSLPIVSTMAIVIALAASLGMFFLVMVPLYKAQKNNAKSTQEMIGKVAEVTVPISENAKGEIVYNQGSSRLSSPAQSEKGESFEIGEIVEITDVVSGTFIVKKTGGKEE